MKKELEVIAKVAGLTVGIALLSNSAFSLGTRKKMFQRDQGECVDCGKRFSDGWLLDCSHNDHNHSNENYDDVNNGRVQCLDDHLKYHQQIGDRNGAYLIQRRIQETHGGRTRQWIADNVDNQGKKR